MSTTAPEPQATAEVTPPPEPTPTPAPEPPKPETPKANPWDDPKAAQAEIERLRRENGSARTNAKATAAQEARQELAQPIGKALGLVQDEPIDPAQLTKQLTAEKAATQAARVELAVFRAAPAANGDPAALLDSQSFLKSLNEIDPTDTAAVQAAIETAIQANPRLGVAAGSRLPNPNPAQGTGANGPVTPSQLTERDLHGMTPEQIDGARKEGRLDNLLGIRH